jgi:hypothetical protein
VGNFTSLSYDWQDNERSTHLNITQDTLVSTIGSSSITENSNEEAKAKLWKRLKENGTVYLHVHVTHEGFSSNPKANNFDRLKTIHQVHSLIKYAPRQNAKNATFLLSRHFPGSIFDMTPKKIAPKRILTKEEEDYLASDPALTTAIISYWKPV